MSPKKVDKMYAFVVIDEDGDEAVPAFQTPDGLWWPLMGADLSRVDSLRAQVQRMATASGQPLRLLVFTERTDLEVIEP